MTDSDHDEVHYPPRQCKRSRSTAFSPQGDGCDPSTGANNHEEAKRPGDIGLLIRERIIRLQELMDALSHGFGSRSPAAATIQNPRTPDTASRTVIDVSDSDDDDSRLHISHNYSASHKTMGKRSNNEGTASYIVIDSDDEEEEEGHNAHNRKDSPPSNREKTEGSEPLANRLKVEEELQEQPQPQLQPQLQMDPHQAPELDADLTNSKPQTINADFLKENEPVVVAVSREQPNRTTELLVYHRRGRNGLPEEQMQKDGCYAADLPEHRSPSDKDLIDNDNGNVEIHESGEPIVRQGSYSPETPGHEEMQPPTDEVGLENDFNNSETDVLEDLWKEMHLAMGFSKRVTQSSPIVQQRDECEHQCIFKEDLGLVCRVCGLIQKPIDKIIDYQWTKRNNYVRVYPSGLHDDKAAKTRSLLVECHSPEEYLRSANISIDPRHAKLMRQHQFEGFCFLARNLLSENAGGCILAHAPGSGKTFMLISFIHCFLTKYPSAKILVVLPKGIVSSWKKEFQKWLIGTEDIPLHDFYSRKAGKRDLQLEVLNQWAKEKSILFLSYQQFSNIVSTVTNDEISIACTEHLLKVPNLLIIDEGHTPRNEDTNVLRSLLRVQTPLKVVLSGTLFQNRVNEVFNILNLVRPHFLKMDSSKDIVNRIKSHVLTSNSWRKCKESAKNFFDLVEFSLQNDEDFKTKTRVIEDLRKMTQNVLHYYKGDFLDELPGIVDLTVHLNLTTKQKKIDKMICNLDIMKRLSLCGSVYLHPRLKEVSEAGEKGLGMIDNIINTLDIDEGVKTRFFINILSMSESAGEKILVFSQYLPPLKFLERLLTKMKGWCMGKEMFMISGKSTSEQRECSMEQFNNSPVAKVLLGSIKACGEGISLVGASRVMILDVHLNPSVSRQAIGRAYRPGQTKKVYVYRLIAADTVEEENHKVSFRKELTSKMWFEWKDGCNEGDFALKKVGLEECEDIFLENPNLTKDIKTLYRRFVHAC